MTPIERRIRTSSVLVIVGLLIEVASLLWGSPLAFLLFLSAGTGFVLAGIALFLISLITVGGGPSTK